MQEQAPQIYFFGFVRLGRQPYESKGNDDGEVPTDSAVFPFPFSPPPLWTMGQLPSLPTPTDALAEVMQKAKQQQQRGTSRRDE